MQVVGWRDLDFSDFPFILEADLDQWAMMLDDASRLSLAPQNITYRLHSAQQQGTCPEAGARYRRKPTGPDGELMIALGLAAKGKRDAVYFEFVKHIQLGDQQGDESLLEAFSRFGAAMADINRASGRQRLRSPWAPREEWWKLTALHQI